MKPTLSSVFVALSIALSVGCDNGSASPAGNHNGAPSDSSGGDELWDGSTSRGDWAEDAVEGATDGSSETEGSWGDDTSFVPRPDVGGDDSGYVPIYTCDDPNADVPGESECMDATPGTEMDWVDRRRVPAAFEPFCQLERACGDQWGVDCLAAADGYYYYVASESLEVLLSSWFAPPPQWNCPIF